ncbi:MULTISPECIES: ankyrin repeat domain-containing protein [Rhizobium/Agrobacterium group]|uniref:Uncharacterized protein n=2 Tax=Rhizobium/Agrobacterium group TaxID=227290 RepID=B9JVA2_ALLAM|nr:MULTISPECIES: ankyrin repeat domain-containing protein [Rhizobium/Agrobacterium group]ACM36182.1 hypothetical protein Avi_1649 [Allorhizobium ampelinum S4]MUO30674.1 hypothetical protein [Agrobacterium vitis]MUO43887.1 hypothetical protein [Agrobacterium vitis]MUP12035.1 hypothetical protein [Agrobacterium vitis]
MSVNLDRLERWEEKFLRGDHSDDSWVISQLKSEPSVNGIPLLFRAAYSTEGLRFLAENGVNILQRSEDGSTLLMEARSGFDIETYRWLAGEFAKRDAIDLHDEEGFTALSVKIKFGELEEARILLENGASIRTFATVARYGNRRLTIPRQAVICTSRSELDPQQVSIEALKLLQEFGYDPSKEEVAELLSGVSEDKPELRKWVSENLASG